MTKLQKKVNASKRSKKKRIAVALQKFLKTQNPAAKYAGAKIQRNKGSITIIPVKLPQARGNPSQYGSPMSWTEYVILLDGREESIERTKSRAQWKADQIRAGLPRGGPGRVRIKKRHVGVGR